MKLACTIALALTVSTASAQTTAATRGVAGTTAADAFERVTRADDACHPRCTSKVVASKRTEADQDIELREATNTSHGMHRYRVALRDAGGWWAWNEDGLELPADDCGMGKCIAHEIERVAFEDAGDLAWIRIRVRTEYTRHLPSQAAGNRTYRRDVVIGCRWSARACAAVDPDWIGNSRAHVRGTKVTIRRADRDDVTALAL